jgi:alanine racemase
MQGFSTHSGILTINLTALAKNYQILQQKVGENCAVAGVMKANAYGLGIEKVMKTLQKQKCPQYFVANLDEALEFREFNKRSPLAVLGGLFHDEEKTYSENNLIPVLNTLDDIKRWNKWGQDNNKITPAFLHLDTGMNRLGLSHQEFNDLLDNLDDLKSIDVQTIMSHFVAADDWAQSWAKELTIAQSELFSDMTVRFKRRFPRVKKSLANSPGVFRSHHFHHDMVRPGFALYGGNPTPEKKNPMKQVVSLNTRILQIREPEKHETIGYGATYKFKKNTRTATIALGYADGFLRSASSDKNKPRAQVYYNKIACPVIGRVSMDLVTIDISHIEKKALKQGDSIEILGPNQSIDDLAQSAGTIGYEILTSLGHRYKREYL